MYFKEAGAGPWAGSATVTVKIEHFPIICSHLALYECHEHEFKRWLGLDLGLDQHLPKQTEL